MATDPDYRLCGVRGALGRLVSRLCGQLSWTGLGAILRHTCVILGPPYIGDRYIHYTLRLYDGTKWLLRVPAKLDVFDEWRARVLAREAVSTQFIARMTSIPVAKVHAFSASFDNPLR